MCPKGHLLVQVNSSETHAPICTAYIQVCLQTDLYDVHVFMSRTIGAIKGTQVKTLRRLFVSQMAAYSRAYLRIHYISPVVNFSGAKRYAP